VLEPRKTLFWWMAGALIALLVFGNQGFREWIGAAREKRRIEKSLSNLRGERERLTRELAWLKQDNSYFEYLIRKNLGYVKKGEVEYRLMKPKKTSNSAS
jgi:cell division protein FtsB